MSTKTALSLILFCGKTLATWNVDAVTAQASSFSAKSDNVQGLKEERLLNEEQHIIEPYALWDPSKFPEALKEWEEKYPNFIRVTTAQEEYGLPAAGNDNDCPFYEKKGCPNYIFTIQDYVSNPIDSEFSTHLPEVFWSGCLHGDERVGPTSVMEAANLLLESAYCESLPQAHGVGLKEAKECRKALHNKGIDDVHRKWLARLVSTRRIVVAPTANALGYYRNDRTEDGVDPNRDFPYDLLDFNLCMKTIAARTINEIYREHMFQLALTFHGGMEVVAYEWGAPTWYNHLSPDDEAQSQIGGAYSRYGGGWQQSKPYAYGTMNDEVYYVRGGMEDWAYAGSWTPSLVKSCTPSTFGGYLTKKTEYNNSTLRVFNILVETSDKKEPKVHLGTSLDVLSGDTKGNGHVSRNIRLSLLAADLVQPYVSVVGVNKLALTDDIVPLRSPDTESCKETKAVMVAKNAKKVDIEWTVGGALTIDNTQLWYALWDDVFSQVECRSQPFSTENLKKAGGPLQGTGFFSAEGPQAGSLQGTGFFSAEGSESATGMRMTNGPLFRASVPLTEFKKGDKIVILASAKVDQSWKNQPEDFVPKMSPQSHIVNARTDDSYQHTSNGKHIQGRIDWFSEPLTVEIGDFDDSIGTRGDDSVNVIEIHPRLGESPINKGGVKPKAAQTDQLYFPVAFWQFLAAVGLLVAILFCVARKFLCGDPNARFRKQGEIIQGSDDFSFDDNKYSDRVDDEYGDDDIDDGIEIPIIT